MSRQLFFGLTVLRTQLQTFQFLYTPLDYVINTHTSQERGNVTSRALFSDHFIELGEEFIARSCQIVCVLGQELRSNTQKGCLL